VTEGPAKKRRQRGAAADNSRRRTSIVTRQSAGADDGGGRLMAQTPRTFVIRHPFLVLLTEGDDDTLLIGVHPQSGCRTVPEYGRLVAHLVHHIANSVEPVVEPATVWGWVDAMRKPNAAVLVWRRSTDGSKMGRFLLWAEPYGRETKFGFSASTLSLEELAKLVVAAAEAIVTQLRANADQLWFWANRERYEPTKEVNDLAPADLPPELRPFEDQQ
jgi:hypothetical protein